MVQRALGISAIADDPPGTEEVMHLLLRVPGDAQVLRDFGEYLLLELGRSEQTVRGYGQQLTAVARMLRKAICEVSVQDIRYEVKRDECCALSTKNLRITSYKQLHGWGLLEKEKWADPAMLGVKTLPSPKRMPRPPISLLDARKLLANCRTPNEKRVVYLPLYGGLRVCESARIERVNLYGDAMTFIGKGDKERTIPVHPELRKVLPEILSVKPKSKEVLIDVMTKLRDRLGTRDLKGRPATTHSLRRTCSDFLYDKLGAPREVVKAVLGHGSEVTDLYAPVRLGKMADWLYQLDYSLGEPVQLTLF